MDPKVKVGLSIKKDIDPIKKKYYDKLDIKRNMSEPKLNSIPPPSQPIDIKTPNIKKNGSQDDFEVCYSFYYHKKLDNMHKMLEL